jgi:hypothetical protein
MFVDLVSDDDDDDDDIHFASYSSNSNKLNYSPHITTDFDNDEDNEYNGDSNDEFMLRASINEDKNDGYYKNKNSNEIIQQNENKNMIICNNTLKKRPLYKLSKEEEKEKKRKEKELNKKEKEEKMVREKINKKKLKDIEDQEKGKHKFSEISIILDSYFNSADVTFGMKIETYFADRNDQHEFGLYRENLALFTNSNQFSQCGLIQWTFRKSTQGGKCSIGSIDSEIMPIVAISIPR